MTSDLAPESASKFADVGDCIEAANASWSFGNVSGDRFDRHVQNSIPLYAIGHELVEAISDFFLTDDSRLYDLGCSTGALLESLARRHATKRIRLIGIDAEPDMIDCARSRCHAFPNIELRHENLIDSDLEAADLIVAYYTLQFVRPKHRQALFDRIYSALNWGGSFLLFEKVRAPDARFQDMMTSIYTDFKRDRGYSSDAILAKARSLKGVLEPFSTAGNLGLLQRAGFVDITTVMKYVCFEGFLAIK
ncbi:methyltransferase domain protein [Rubidibacter lacunae KORDI 51-2]|uniref:Methyltransferase domain protein n=1 Tax=Rubidibacter lacunae KORDI 51-2 TaxID=582515 RepID=U5DPE5_9CHRO|nr:methyltransferase domain-containing protein [Rubidibacter lacunae]ERN41570.1 methyltransferase domain protein [Rubidibacter lacunae KORDI 51-2]